MYPRVFIGLGNPGNTFAFTRHNAGFRVIDKIASLMRVRLKKPLFRDFLVGRGVHCGNSLLLAKPLTFMNHSGKVLRAILKAGGCRIDQCVVICDTLDLPPGACRIKRKGSSAGHRGLSSLIEYSGTSDFARVYIGIGRPQNKTDVREYVLSNPAEAEKALLERAEDRVADALLSLFKKPFERVSSELNGGHV